MKSLFVLPASFLLLLGTLTSFVLPSSTVQAATYKQEAKYRAGFNDGYTGGYRYGFHDGRKGIRYRVRIEPGRGAYMLGYVDGYYKGYAAGYSDGRRRVKYFVPVIRW